MSETRQARPGRLLLGSAVFVIVLAAVVLLAVPNDILAPPKPPGSTTTAREQPADAPPPTVSSSGTAVYGAPATSAPMAMNVLGALPSPSVIVDVHKPAELWRAARANPWLQEILDEPLGRGFLGTWAGFLGTRGADIRAGFEGLVIDHLAERVLADPFRAVWFSGGRTTGKPAIILEQPSSNAQNAFDVLDAVASRGTYTAERCFDGEPPEDGDFERPLELTEITIKRWLLADHAVYASIKDDRLVIGRRATVVLQGMCADLPGATEKPASAVEVGFNASTLGRGADIMTRVLGFTGAPRLAFDVVDGNVVPRGIKAGVTGNHLATGKLSNKVLRTIPESAPVVLAVQLNLPKALDQDSLDLFLAGEKTENAARQIAVLWYPSGGNDGIMDMALLWDADKDAQLVDQMFGGSLIEGSGCKVLVRCTSESVCRRIERTCQGKDPSVLQASPAVKAGWQEETSVALGFHLGRTLSTITIDAYRDELDREGALPPEMQAVKKQLEALPFFGLRGTAQSASLVPGGFRS